MKLWFGVSKFASTSSHVNAIEWEIASNLVRTSHETHTALGPVSMSDCTLSYRPNFATGITRRNIGLWLSNGLHESVIHLLKGVYVHFVIALPIINHTSYTAGGRLKMSHLN